jgi:hypothetical protein
VRRLVILLGTSALSALLACEPTGPPPYGFDQETVQRFVFESEEHTDVDGSPATVIRYAEVELEASAASQARTELALRLERYYMRVEGAPGGTSEIALSPTGLVSRDPVQGELRLDADQPVPGGRTVGALLRQAVASAVLRSDGALVGSLWHSREASLGDLPLMEWILLALPIVSDAEGRSWTGRRPVPPLGQYELGIEIPLRFERADAFGREIRSSGSVRREALELAEGFRGLLEITYAGEASLSPAGAIDEARLQLHALFRDEQGGEVRAHYRARLRCADCGAAVNPPPEGSDTPKR